MNKFIQFDDKLLNIDKTVSFHLEEYSDNSSYLIIANLSTNQEDQLPWYFEKKEDRDNAWHWLCIQVGYHYYENFLPKAKD